MRRSLAVVAPLRHRDFRLLWVGQTISFFGNSIYAVALPFQILALHGSAIQLGTGFALSSGASVVMLLFGGVIVDRVSRRRVILASDLLSGVVVAVIAVLGLTGHLQIYYIYIAALFFGAASAFYLPAMSSILPDLVPPEILVAGNSLQSLSRQVARVFGPLAGGVLVSAAGSPIAFAVDAASFLISFAVFFVSNDPPLTKALRRSVWIELKEGFRFAASVPWIWITIWAFAVINFFYLAPITVGLPLLVHDVLGGGAKVFGLIGAAAGIGEIAASLAVGQFKVQRLGVFLYLASALEGVAFLTIGIVPLIPVAMFGYAIFSACIVAFTVHWDSALQRLVPRELLGRVTSLDWFGAILLGPGAPIFGALLAQRAGPRGIFIVCGGAAMILSLAGLTIPSIRHLTYRASLAP